MFHTPLRPRVRVRILLHCLGFTFVACVIVSATIMYLYPVEDWLWELSISNTLTVTLTMSMTYFILTKLEQITQLTDRLRELVERDRLTDVATRDFFFERLSFSPEAYGISLMVDIDHFKAVNDTYGHLAGDDVIARVAAILKENVRDNDIVCRFGGEEFVIFLYEAGPDEGALIAERIRVETQSARTDTSAGNIAVTVSIGGSMKEQLEHIDDAIKRADDALYIAKAKGRNRTFFDWEQSKAA